MRVVFMGTPDFAVPCLDILLKRGDEVVAVITQPDRPKGRGQKLTSSPVKQFAIDKQLTVYQPEKIKDTNFINQLASMCPDIIVVVAFGQFLPKSLLELPSFGCINVHASLLPKYRGAAPIHWSVINGEAKTGVTTMYMDIGMDTGDMILKAETIIEPDQTTGSLHDKLQAMGAKLLMNTLELIEQGKASRTPQDESQATYAPLITRDIERIDWRKSAFDIHNLIRGLNPWPGAFCMDGNKILKVWKAEVLDTQVEAKQPGSIASVTQDGVVVVAGQGCVKLLEVQPESKRRMSANQFAHGHSITSGYILG